jgi:threonylcarbamoyladenosine tRNA methylthiotransferase MtaB
MKVKVEGGWSSKGKVALQTLGCKLNQAETESLARKFVEAGYQIVAPDGAADIYVLNTCTVTHIADRKCRNLLRLAHRRNPEALIVAAGCYAERAYAEVGEVEGVGLVVGNRDKARLTEIVQARTNGHGSRGPGDICKSSPFRTRALVKIQEGCSQSCSFCVVPRVRGREISCSQNDIIAEVKGRVAEGYKEVILTGTRIGSYEQEGGLGTLVERILSESEVQRLRLSSLEPCDLTPELLNLWGDSRLCPHIHLPLQSGCDSVLQGMGRAYDTADYERAAALAREAIPNLALTTDIMVGFPGEGEEEFDESYRFCERMGFAAMHVFPFSARPGTKAARMRDRVGDSEKKQRCQLMLNLANRGGQRFREQFVGRSMNVLWEDNKDSIWFGLTENYMRVFFLGREQLTNQIIETKIVAQHDGLLQGELIN